LVGVGLEFPHLTNFSGGVRYDTWSLTLREEHRLRDFESTVLRIFGPKREEMAGDWRRPHSKGIHNFYTSLNFIRVMKSRRMKWEAHVMHKIFWLEDLKGRDHLEVLTVDEMIILE
jgi:hypothetical protein